MHLVGATIIELKTNTKKKAAGLTLLSLNSPWGYCMHNLLLQIRHRAIGLQRLHLGAYTCSTSIILGDQVQVGVNGNICRMLSSLLAEQSVRKML